jgi:hypothetical protein
MSRKPSKVMSPLARTRAERRALRAEMKRVAEITERHLREAVEEGLLPGHVEADGTVVLDGDAFAPAPRRGTRGA